MRYFAGSSKFFTYFVDKTSHNKFYLVRSNTDAVFGLTSPVFIVHQDTTTTSIDLLDY